MPPQDRRPFYLYCDEFQRFATSDFATIISESRKFNIRPFLSNQVIEQLDRANRAAVEAAGVLIVFRVSGQDGRAIARNFDTTPRKKVVIGTEPVRSPVADVLGHLTRRGHTHPEVSKFISDYLQPLETLVGNVGSYHRPFEFGCMVMRNVDVTGGRQFLNDCLSEAMRTGKADIFIQPLALLVLGGAADDGITYVFETFQKYFIIPPPEFRGLDKSANFFGMPSFLNNPQAIKALHQKKLARKKVSDDFFRSRIVTPGPSFIRMLRSLRNVMMILAREPILVDTGQYRDKYQLQTYQDAENEIGNFLSSGLRNFEAKVKILTTEYTIRTRPAPHVLSGQRLAERIGQIKRQMRRAGYTRHYVAVAAEIQARSAYYRGLAEAPPPHSRKGASPPPPPDSGAARKPAESPPPPPPSSSSRD